MLLFATNIKDTWLPKLISSDRIFPPKEYNCVDIECNSQHNLIKDIDTSTIYGKFFFLSFFCEDIFYTIAFEIQAITTPPG